MTCETPTTIDEALAKFLTTDSTRLSDGVRSRGRHQVRQTVYDRVFCGRKPERSMDMPCVTLELVGGNPGYHFHGETQCAYSSMAISTWSLLRSQSASLTENLRRLLTGFSSAKTNGAQWCGVDVILCHLLSPPRLIESVAFPGSDEYWFSYQTVWRVMHSQVIPRESSVTVIGS